MTRTHRQQAADFAQWLEEQGACVIERRWALGRTLQDVWCQQSRGIPTLCWTSMRWLLRHLYDDKAITKQWRAILETRWWENRITPYDLSAVEFIDVEVDA